MKKSIVFAAVVACAFLFAPQPASALVFTFHGYKSFHFKKFKFHHFKHKFHHVKVKPTPSQPQHAARRGHSFGFWKGYVSVGMGCSAISLIAYADYVGRRYRRELNQLEAQSIVADCFLPFIGSALVRQAYRYHRLQHFRRMAAQVPFA